MRFLLIHGGWQGSWCWDGMVAELGRRGHEAYAPTLPGCDPDDSDRTYRGMRALARHAAAEIVALDADEVVVVGHSGGGPIAQTVFEEIPDRVRQVIFVDAFVLADGMSIFDEVPAAMVEQFTAVAAGTPDRVLPMSEDIWINGLCTDATDADARRWLSLTVPLPIAWLEERLSLPTFASSGVPTGYIFLDNDTAVFDRALFQRQAARLECPRIATCPGSHEAILTQPLALTDALLDVVALVPGVRQGN
jgi:pimeloyl-ACP methyl ester carboxylesterase